MGSTLVLDTGVAIYGGFSGKERNRQDAKPFSFKTVLSGDIGRTGDPNDNAWTVVTTTERNKIDGFHITGGSGKSDFATGVLGIGDLEISRSVLIENHSKYGTGGMALFNGNPMIRECYFIGNTGQTAGAINAANSNPAILNCVFYNNQSANWGGAVLLQAVGSGMIGNSTFYMNGAPMGSALAIVAGEADFTSKVEIGNSIFWKNQSKEQKDARESEVYVGQINRNNVELSMVSCIVKNGTDPKSSSVRVADTAQTSSEFISVRDADPLLKMEKSRGLLAGPDGVYFSSDDGLNVEFGSPAINTGSNLPLITTDILGRPRMNCSRPDIGAFEN